MAANIYVYCPSGEEGLYRGKLEAELEDFFGTSAELCGGGGGGAKGFNIDFELVDGEDLEAWVERLKSFLSNIGVRPSTFFTVHPDDWEPGMPWRRVEVFGEDRWLKEQQT